MEALSEAQQLDAYLDLWPDVQVPTGLVRRTTALATHISNILMIGWRLSWIGAGLAAAMSGLAAGSVAASMFLPADTYYTGTTIFGDIADFEE
ncbi:hypothetical protein [Pararhizobium sp. PWRC1-1]|uniref:hypothetical protein n=1 Tax=Pararhizobium sp. PWRC1-1 TaxID=2804566 RepID=UPI003CF60225